MKKRTHVFLSLLLICISAGLLGLLLSNMRHNAKSAAESLAREELNIDVGIFAKQDIPENLLPELIDSSGKRENLLYSFQSPEQSGLNRFLTLFSEQSFGTYDPDDAAALVDFAYQYLLLHRDDAALEEDGLADTVEGALKTVGLSNMLDSNAVDAVANRFFRKTIEHTEDVYYFLNTGVEAGKRISVAKAMYANVDGSYTVEFDLYDVNPKPISCPFSPEDLMNAEPREGVGGYSPFPIYARSVYPNLDWEFIGTTSGTLDPNPNEYLGYDVYRVNAFGQSLLFVSPVGYDSDTENEIYAYDAASHTMTLVFLNGSFLDTTYFTLSDLDARVHPALTYISSGTAVVWWRGEASNAFYQLISYDVGKSEARQAVRFGADGQYRLNLFLSNFSEQYFRHYNAEDKDALIQFVYMYLKINDPDALEPAEDHHAMLSASTVDRVLYRFFGRTVEHTESAYYFPMADGDPHTRFSVATAISANGDGTYKVAFDIYELDPVESHYDTVPSEYYQLTASDVRQHTELSRCGSGSAVIRDYTIGNDATYQVISYQSDEIG